MKDSYVNMKQNYVDMQVNFSQVRVIENLKYRPHVTLNMLDATYLCYIIYLACQYI